MKKKIASSFGLTLLSSGLLFGFNFFIAKILGAETYGQISYYLSFVQIVALLISFNHPALYMGNKITQEDSNTFSLFVSVESLVFAIVALPVWYIIYHYTNSNEITLLILLIAYSMTITILIGLDFNADKKISESIVYSTLIPRLVLVVVFSGLIFTGLASVVNYLYVYMLGFALVAGYFFLKYRPSWYIKKAFFNRAWKFYLLGIIGSSFKPIANILQKEFYGYKELATLSIATLMLAGIYMFGGVLVKFVLPKIHEAWKKKDLVLIEKLYSNNTKLEVIIVGPLVAYILAYVSYLSGFLGNGYGLLPTYLSILMIGFIPDFFTGITGNLLRSTENEKYEIYNEIILFCSGIGLIYLLKNYENGIVFAISISMLLYNIAKFLEVKYILKIKPFNLRDLLLLSLYLVGLFLVFNFLKITIGENIGIFISLFILAINGYFVLKYIKKHKLLKGFE